MINPVASIAQIQRQAEEAADNERGPQANHFPEGSEAHKAWLTAYYARVKFNSEQVAA